MKLRKFKQWNTIENEFSNDLQLKRWFDQHRKAEAESRIRACKELVESYIQEPIDCPNNNNQQTKETDGAKQVHRPLQSPWGPWNSLITKNLGYKDPLRHCKEAQQAEADELANLRKKRVWTEDEVGEYSNAVEQFPDALFANVLSLIGIKHYEYSDKSKWKWKGLFH